MEKQEIQSQSDVNLNIDTTYVLFTDYVIWNITNDEVVLNFGQKILGTNKIKIVARVGTSKEFMKKFLGDLGKNIALTEVQGQTGKLKS